MERLTATRCRSTLLVALIQMISAADREDKGAAAEAGPAATPDGSAPPATTALPVTTATAASPQGGASSDPPGSEGGGEDPGSAPPSPPPAAPGPAAKHTPAATRPRPAAAPRGRRSQPPPVTRILVAAHTNVAVDRVLLGLVERGFTDFVRVGSLQRIAKPILPVRTYCARPLARPCAALALAARCSACSVAPGGAGVRCTALECGCVPTQPPLRRP
jgi:hypothetical protein